MIESNGGGLLLIGLAFVLLRPADVPLFARVAGRVCGASIHTMKGLRRTLDATVAEGREIAGMQGGDIAKMREDLSESLSKFDKVAGAFRRDMATVPLSPRSLFHRGLQMARSTGKELGGEQGSHQGKPTAQKANPVISRRSVPDLGSVAAAGTLRRPGSISSDSGGGAGRTSTGADFIARSIEEAALARQQERVFGGGGGARERSASSTGTDSSKL